MLTNLFKILFSLVLLGTMTLPHLVGGKANKILPENFESQCFTVERIIEDVSEKYNYPYEKSLALASCESNLIAYSYNREGSSAKGLYQFIDSTWRENCKGDVFDPIDNAKCAISLLSEGKTYHWEADIRVIQCLKEKHNIENL